MNRHVRQMILPEVGEAGQERLARAHVLVVGAGGLASTALMGLAGAGVGSLTIVDPDVVEESNLHRQPIHAGNVGMTKAASAARFVERLDPAIHVTPLVAQATPATIPALMAPAQVVLDCGDSFALSYALSDACRDAGVPLISASALMMGGYCGGFCGGAPSLRAVFPDLPDRAGDCASAGVLGPVVMMLGACQAQMALTLLLTLQPSPLGQLVTLGAGLRWGGFRFDGAPEPGNGFVFIAPEQITSEDFVVDLRGEDETAVLVSPHALRATVDTLPVPPDGARTVIACRSGLRAWRAARLLAPSHPDLVLIATGGN